MPLRKEGEDQASGVVPTPEPKPNGRSVSQATPPMEPDAPDIEAPKREADRNPFRQYSLLGDASHLALSAAETKPLFGKFIIQGQMTVLYAAPNTGKTLLMIYLCLQAISRGLMDAKNLYYINADDSSDGLATKVGLLEEVGAHTLAPGHKGFRTADLATLLTEAAEGGFARGMCIVIDTLKKFTDLMDKKASSRFAQTCRQFVSKGGTIVALGHTTKNPNSDGTPRYQGTTDVVEDCDAAYFAQLLTSKSGSENKVVKFTRFKSRASSPDVVAYAYVAETGLSYAGMVATVQPIDPDDLDDYAPRRENVSDPPVMQAVLKLIEPGWDKGKMALAEAVSKECGVSKRGAVEVIERYDGPNPREHLWSWTLGPRGVHIYQRLPHTLT